MSENTEERSEGELFLGTEKREFPRVPMIVPVRFRKLSNEEAEKAGGRYADINNMLEQYDEGETANVSKTGILMYTNEELPSKSSIAVNMHFSIPGIACNCKAIAEVIRRQKSDKERYNYLVALKFTKIVHHNLKNYRFQDLNNLLDVRDPMA
ncbi:MAG: PilZ domain-containing protein [Spirochaetia bacterium]|nr:PilZ domain-containing protein [Spirochaetia bacterium]